MTRWIRGVSLMVAGLSAPLIAHGGDLTEAYRRICLDTDGQAPAVDAAAKVAGFLPAPPDMLAKLKSTLHTDSDPHLAVVKTVGATGMAAFAVAAPMSGHDDQMAQVCGVLVVSGQAGDTADDFKALFSFAKPTIQDGGDGKTPIVYAFAGRPSAQSQIDISDPAAMNAALAGGQVRIAIALAQAGHPMLAMFIRADPAKTPKPSPPP